ncbi:MAG: hypothetical protein COV91_03995 [Candidatus Taylorbacteria bacterium CG11_big_fil_rev_8_21_14_0_20_46_11]|uniref:Uncharacterized protein n=1 Tax=Candidatus Taylorbacteria bacterium CG11_big_fil_rev_8_21_14_0_20_46_11 TaxID=1975025 RepID=A0A2H0KD12_9BACT|nr:MAG: hypothetical protein COV91_03995 [Candidatus Taylorbacteria bacterium CG11_big_fil_rev_8_21_14_0_20_46_11]
MPPEKAKALFEQMHKAAEGLPVDSVPKKKVIHSPIEFKGIQRSTTPKKIPGESIPIVKQAEGLPIKPQPRQAFENEWDTKHDEEETKRWNRLRPGHSEEEPEHN